MTASQVWFLMPLLQARRSAHCCAAVQLCNNLQAASHQCGHERCLTAEVRLHGYEDANRSTAKGSAAAINRATNSCGAVRAVATLQ